MAESSDARCHLVVSRLLDYPEPDLVADLPVLAEVGAGLPQGRLLRPLLEHLGQVPLLALQQDYVATFDQRRRCCLYLTYYAFGDTRKRGAALLAFKQAYRAAGVELDDGELPDHLCVLLEFAGSVDPAAGRRLLLEHRAGLELLHLSLRDAGSPYAAALDAVSATLPALRGDERDAVRRLVAQGPPGEDVGLDPFGPPTGVPVTAEPAPRTAFIDLASVGVRR